MDSIRSTRHSSDTVPPFDNTTIAVRRARGPQTAEGKARVRLNAVRHGISARHAVIPGVERAEDWEAHRAAVLASVAAEGALEIALAERAAHALWRLQRVAAYETHALAERQALATSTHDPVRFAPRPEDVDKIVRYEAHLSRQLYQALHELEALQARRQGQATPLARLDVHGLPEEG
jgi:hypothetical protein